MCAISCGFEVVLRCGIWRATESDDDDAGDEEGDLLSLVNVRFCVCMCQFFESVCEFCCDLAAQERYVSESVVCLCVVSGGAFVKRVFFISFAQLTWRRATLLFQFLERVRVRVFRCTIRGACWVCVLLSPTLICTTRSGRAETSHSNKPHTFCSPYVYRVCCTTRSLHNFHTIHGCAT